MTQPAVALAREKIADGLGEDTNADYAAAAYGLFLLDSLASKLDGPAGDSEGGRMFEAGD